MRGRGDRLVQGQGQNKPRQTAHTLAAHGIALVSHCGAAYLIFFKRLLHFLAALQNAHIVAELVSALSDCGQCGQNRVVELARVSLSRHVENLVKAHFLSHEFFQPVNLVAVAVKQREETRLRSRRALDASELQLRQGKIQRFQIHKQILNIERESLAYGCQLSRLQMSV